ncbi:RHS repeat domain-containing protein [Streptomyces sp. JH34]|uniref:RHS repeat domain-containing protein n=1 Tax=Streptomyces sp. JH34 TaxID=2793633 RepID=UPI0023F90814|nr:RHS repeat domain-containing protein [Streptomyces sp. JH34]MDF6016969.1 hypothetical protein [Streptomyces sp. JH34]
MSVFTGPISTAGPPTLVPADRAPTPAPTWPSARQTVGADLAPPSTPPLAEPDVWRYVYDAEDRPTSCVTPDGTRWTYAHDPLGRGSAKHRTAAGDRRHHGCRDGPLHVGRAAPGRAIRREGRNRPHVEVRGT